VYLLFKFHVQFRLASVDSQEPPFRVSNFLHGCHNLIGFAEVLRCFIWLWQQHWLFDGCQMVFHGELKGEGTATDFIWDSSFRFLQC
jgi:hypothetical protein